MTTLTTGTTQLSQIDRRRDLADALQRQAVSTAPIAHRNQGFAKLAQALLANQLNKTATKKEKEARDKRREALSDALGPVTETGRLPDTATILDSIEEGGEPESLHIPGKRFEFERPKNTAEILEKLGQANAPLAEGVLANILQQQIEADLGLGTSDDKDPYRHIGLRSVTRNGVTEEAEVFSLKNARDGNPAGTPGVFEGGRFTALDSDQIGGVIDRSTDVPFDSDQELFDSAVEAHTVIGQFGMLADAVNAGGFSNDNTVGKMRRGAENAIEGLQALFKTIGVAVGEITIGGLSHPDDGLFMTDNMHNKATKNVAGRQINVTEEDRIKYTPEDLVNAQDSWDKFIQLDARTQQLGISIAYTLARIADPGGRLSEMDVMNQIRALGLDSSSVQGRIEALQTARFSFAERMRFQIDLARENGSTFRLTPGFEKKIDDIISGVDNLAGASTDDVGIDVSTPFSSEEDFKQRMRKASPQQRRRLEREQGLTPGTLDNL